MPVTPNRDADSISVGPGLLYIAKLGTAEPTGLDPSAWDAAIIEMGYTDAGSEFQVAPSSNPVNVAEETDPVLNVTSTTASTLKAALAQITAFNLSVAFGGGTITTSTGLVTYEPPAAGEERSYMVLWLAIDHSEGIIWRKVQPDGSLDLNRQAGANKATIPLNLSILAPGGGVASWKWMGLAPERTGPDPFLVGLTDAAEATT